MALACQPGALREERTVWMGNQVILMSFGCKISKQTDNLRLTATPIAFRINVQNFERAAMTASAQFCFSPLIPIPIT